MKEINAPFSLYDFFAILFPGLLGIISLYLFLDPSLRNINLYIQGIKGVNEFVLVLVLIVVCYFVGHIFNTLGNLFVERPATRFLGWTVNNYLTQQGMVLDKGMRGFVIKDSRLRFPKRIFEYTEKGKLKPFGTLLKSCIEVTFGKINQDYGYTYRLIHAYVTQCAPDSAAEAKIFTATAAMYESLTVTFVLIVIALLKGIWIGQTGPGVATIIVAFSLGLSVLCFSSSRRYKRMWVETIYAAFVAAVKSQNIAGKTS